MCRAYLQNLRWVDDAGDVEREVGHGRGRLVDRLAVVGPVVLQAGVLDEQLAPGLALAHLVAARHPLLLPGALALKLVLVALYLVRREDDGRGLVEAGPSGVRLHSTIQ